MQFSNLNTDIDLFVILENIIKHSDIIPIILKYITIPIEGIKIAQYGQFNNNKYLDCPNNMQIDNNELYVSDSKNQRIQIFDLNKKNLTRTIDCKNINGHYTVTNTIHIFDNFIITSNMQKGIMLFFNKKSGNYITTVFLEGKKHSFDIYEFIENEIYKLPHNNYIQVYTLDGKFNREIKGNYINHISYPFKLKIYDEKIYILQPDKILILNSNYQLIKTLSINFGTCLDFLIINDEIYIQPFYGGSVRIICKYTGKYIRSIYIGPKNFNYHWLYFNNNLYISDCDNSLIHVLK